MSLSLKEWRVRGLLESQFSVLCEDDWNQDYGFAGAFARVGRLLLRSHIPECQPPLPLPQLVHVSHLGVEGDYGHEVLQYPPVSSSAWGFPIRMFCLIVPSKRNGRCDT